MFFNLKKKLELSLETKQILKKIDVHFSFTILFHINIILHQILHIICI